MQDETVSADEAELKSLLAASHDTVLFDGLQFFAGNLKKRRQAFFGAPGILLLRPIDCTLARQRGFWAEAEDEFLLLQGDIIYTSNAYFMGERLESGYFALANATCDLVPKRREYAALFPVKAVYAPASPEEEGGIRSLIGGLLSFKSPHRMYLPPLPGDETDVLARFIDFSGVAQATAVDVEIAERIASLSLIGWRIFGVHLRRIFSRAGDGEATLRENWNT